MENTNVLKYEAPELELVFFQTEDILSASEGFTGEDHSFAPMGFEGEDDSFLWY